jgi:aminopeptidase N
LGLASLFAIANLQAQRAPSRAGIDVLDYAITLQLPDSGKSIDGYAVLRVARTKATDSLVLDFVGLKVKGVDINARSVAFRRDSTTLRFALPATSGLPDTFHVTVGYNGEPSDGLIIRTDSLGRYTAFGDNWPNRGRFWIPSVDDPGDKATVTWTVIAPSGRRVVANGALVEETPIAHGGGFTGNRVLTRWTESRPIPVYLMVIAAAPLVYFDLGFTACGLTEIGGCVHQSVYVAPEQRRFLPGPFARANEILEFIARLVGPYPYEKLAHLQSSTRFGGMENASAIFYSDRGFRDRTMGTGVIAHEIAHQWFGNSATAGRWADLWLSEGFATYFAQLWLERSTGDTAFHRSLRESRAGIMASKEVATRPVVDSAETDYLKLLNANSYQKGGWTLHMLRRLVGDSAFFRGVRSYYAKHRHSTATTDDLRAEIETASGQKLDWFFRQWLERPGYPEINTSWSYDRRAKRVQLRVEQGTRFGAYRFPLTLEVRGRSGVNRITVEVPAQRTTTLTLPLELTEAPSAVTFDPDVALLASFRE